MRDFVLSSESVTAGHPDKLCDQIGDAVVDACLAAEMPTGCVAECAIASGVAFLSIRHGGPLDFDPGAIARRVMAEAGYDDHGGTVVLDIAESPQLRGPVPPDRMRASHMTTAFGYACDHNADRMPWPIWGAHRLAAALEGARAEPALAWLSPDAQVQVAVRFEDRRPIALHAVAMTLAPGVAGVAGVAGGSGDNLDGVMRERVIGPAFAGMGLEPDPATRIVVRLGAHRGGPGSHAGLTGRKTGDDGYGSFCRQSGTALSGKDPSRTDRVAAYAARQAAVSVVAVGLARECEVQLSYVAGDRDPASLEIDTFGSGRVSDREIKERLLAAIDFGIGPVVERLRLWALPRRRGGRFFRDLGAHGQVGRPDLALPWDEPVALG
jgi:S-adenosylmethionine synthetase